MLIYINALNHGYDKEIAIQFYKGFKSIGLAPWWPHHSLCPGENRKRIMQKTIYQSDFFLSISSENSIKSGEHIWEQRKALGKMDEMLPNQIFIVPVWAGNPNKFEKMRSKLLTSNLISVILYPDWQQALYDIFKSMGIQIPNNMKIPQLKKGE